MREGWMILVATDFSECAAAALAQGRALAGRLGAGVRVLYVVEPGSPSAAELGPALAAHGLRRQDVVVRTGTAWLEIMRLAVQLQPMAVVVGCHGRSGYQPLSAGSTTQRLLARSPVPVVVVPHRPEGEASGRREEAHALSGMEA